MPKIEQIMAANVRYHDHLLCLFSLLLLLVACTCKSDTITPQNTTQSPIILPPYIIDYRNGTITSYNTTPPPLVPPPNNAQVQSKDITIPSRYHALRARAFLPAHPDPTRKIPILIYFHWGAFCIGTPFLSGDTQYMARVAAEAHVLAITIDYRLYPEFTIPAPYDDAWAVLEWVTGRTKLGHEEPWVTQYGDVHRVYVGGDSAGGNIAYNIAMRAGMSSSFRFEGVFLNMPYFLGKRLVPLEPKSITSSSNYKVWDYVCPKCKGGVDNSYINPFGPEAPSLTHLGCKKLLVYTAEVDELRGRAIWYYKKIKKSNWAGQAQWIEAAGKKHIFHALEPQDPATIKLIHDLSAFLTSEENSTPKISGKNSLCSTL